MIGALSFLSIFIMLGLLVIIAALTFTINLLFLLMPILFIGSLVGLWFFGRMKPSKKWSRYAKVGVVIGLIGSILSFNIDYGMFRSDKVRYMAPEDRYELQIEDESLGYQI